MSLYIMSQTFPKPYEAFGGDINVEVDQKKALKIFHMLILRDLH